ncbi:MAG: AAA family ATPase [Candidatus Eremiobacteraeota bacterium]|nr:AAA family ATPase [Candidatus Eremiobacteraeota bacterium]MBC5826463.1 AAA family ATPase [Candidatus Eremiobacteraeota bacterium]
MLSPAVGSRPPPFVGQRRVVEYFRRLGAGGLGHAYLFCGPRGVGKRTFASVLALTLHCERPASFPTGYCGQCPPCRRGIAGSSGDTILVDLAFIRLADEEASGSDRKTDTLGIKTSLKVRRLMELHSYEGGRLVCIVPDFDRVTPNRDEAYNALLKELEEPRPGKLFLLTTERPDLILPTVRSRTTMVRFDALHETEIARALVDLRDDTPADAAVIARRAQGSLGDALADHDTERTALRQAARRWIVGCLTGPKQLPQAPDLGKDDPKGVLHEVIRQSRLVVRDFMAGAIAGEGAIVDMQALDDCRSVWRAFGPAAASKTVRCLMAIDEAARIATTNVPPATLFAWLEMELRSLAAM